MKKLAHVINGQPINGPTKMASWACLDEYVECGWSVFSRG
jgi:hypothetical protein